MSSKVSAMLSNVLGWRGNGRPAPKHHLFVIDELGFNPFSPQLPIIVTLEERQEVVAVTV